MATVSFHDQPELWNITDPARPVKMVTLPGYPDVLWGQAFLPDGRILADVGYDGAVLVFNIEDPAHPVRTASGRTIVGCGQQPDGHPDYSDTNYSLAFSADGHTLTVIANSAPSMPGPVPARPSAGPAISRWSLTDTGAAAPIAVRDGTGAAAGQLALTPSGRTVALASLP